MRCEHGWCCWSLRWFPQLVAVSGDPLGEFQGLIGSEPPSFLLFVRSCIDAQPWESSSRNGLLKRCALCVGVAERAGARLCRLVAGWRQNRGLRCSLRVSTTSASAWA